MKELAVGFRFLPTEKEIFGYFLPKKNNGEIISHVGVTEEDLYGEKEPWKIFDKNLMENFYVFAKLKKKNESMIKRTAGCGTWVGQNSVTVCDNKGRVLGLKKLLIFRVDKKNGSDGNGNGHWIMHEYSNIHGGDEYVFCRIRNKDLDKDQKSCVEIKGLKKLIHTREDESDDLNQENHQPSKRIRESQILAAIAPEFIQGSNQENFYDSRKEEGDDLNQENHQPSERIQESEILAAIAPELNQGSNQEIFYDLRKEEGDDLNQENYQPSERIQESEIVSAKAPGLNQGSNLDAFDSDEWVVYQDYLESLLIDL